MGKKITNIIKEVAKDMQAEVVFEDWGHVMHINFKNGKKVFFKGSDTDYNNSASAAVAWDKDFSYFFMKKMGYCVPEGRSFFSDSWAETISSDQTVDKAILYAESLGYPVIVKPNSGSQGRGVAKVSDRSQLVRALENAFTMDRVVLVQKCLSGSDYRIVVMDDQVISAYRRKPLSVVGNGVSTVEELLYKKQDLFKKLGRDTKIKFQDPRIDETLLEQGFERSSILSEGLELNVLSNANLSAGGEAEDVTDKLHPSIKDMVIRLTKDMGLRLCGVDFMTESPIDQNVSDYSILEINSSPGLDHYVEIGQKQEEIVKEMYTKILKSLSERG